MKKIIFLFILTLSSMSQANDFDPFHWEPGMHIFAGGGVNSSVYQSSEETFDGGLGLNLKTDIVYFLNPDWAVEASSAIKFNRVNGYLIWDTLLTLGVRTTLPALFSYKQGQPYGRLFVGRAPTVLFLDGDTLESRQLRQNRQMSSEVSRIQFDGPVAGLAVGSLHKTINGTVWFSELAATVQSLEQESDIKMDGDVPIVISNDHVDDHSIIYSVSLTFGIMAF